MVIEFGENEIMKESNDDNKSTAMHVGNKVSIIHSTNIRALRVIDVG